MKRTTALILLVGLLFALTACGRTADDKLTLYEGNALKIEREGAITRIYDLEGGGEYSFTAHRTRAKKGTEGGGSMSKGSILKRLEDLEARYKQDPLIVLASTDSGEEVKITMRECLEREDMHFIKVISGASLEDLDLFLKAMKEEAFRQVEGGSNDNE